MRPEDSSIWLPEGAQSRPEAGCGGGESGGKQGKGYNA